MKWSLPTLIFIGYIAVACSSPKPSSIIPTQLNEIELLILGIAQDAGYPQASCKKDCCNDLWSDKSRRKMVSCLGIRDQLTKKVWIFDATPDLKDQMHQLMQTKEKSFDLDGIFLTHAHMGHYTGLMHLGREAMGADSINVYTMPRMRTYLETNGPWSQLVSLGNIALQLMQDDEAISLAEGRVTVTPFLVPHRDEFSETVGYKIATVNKSLLFIPDIDKWSKWDSDIAQMIGEVDLAFLDGTFYRNGEIWGRDMSQIPHPFIEESMSLLQPLSAEDKAKVHFIHLNHTNPLLDSASEEYSDFRRTGFKLAEEGSIFSL